MALKIDKPGRSKDYILNADRNSGNPTIFTLRPLTWEEYAETLNLSPLTPGQAVEISVISNTAKNEGRDLTADEMARIQEITSVIPEYYRKLTAQFAFAVRHGVINIKGLQDLEGNPLKMNGADFARHGDPKAISELGSEIIKISKLGEDAEKN